MTNMKHMLTIINHTCHCEAKPKQSLFPFKNITGHVLAIMIVMLFATGLFASRTAFAEVKTFEKEYTYQASEIDSKVTSRAIAVEQVKRLVLEELGTYLMAETEVRDFQITKDRVVMLTAGIVQTEILNEKWDGERYYLKARIKADPKEVAVSLDILRKDAQKSKELEDLKKRADNAYKEIERLKTELESVKADKNKQREYTKATNTLRATEWALKGTYADPNLRKVYTIKGDSSIFEKYDQDKKVKSSNAGRPPENPLSFTDEDLEKYKTPESKERDKKIEALTKAIELDPNYTYAYINRGNAYFDKGQYDRAIKDYSRAVALNPDDAYIYGARGLAYINSGQYGKAIEDYNNAIALNPNDADAYTNRAFAYAEKGQYDRAILDYNKAIALNPNNASAYNNRGVAYERIGNIINKAISDYQKACDLGVEIACKNLQGTLRQR